MKLFILICSMLLSTNLYAQESNDLDLFEGDFSLSEEAAKKDAKKRKKFFLIGEVVDGRFNIVHYNDADLLGFTQLLFFPDDDDIGRTARLDLNYQILGTEGRMDIDFSNQLFTREPNPEEDDVQEVLEETVLAIRTRVIKKENDKTYIIIGGSITNKTGKPFLMSYLQLFLHNLGAGTPDTNIERDISKTYFNAIVGAGKVFDILHGDRVKLSVIAEAELEVSTDIADESRVGTTFTLAYDFAGKRTLKDPKFQVRLFYKNELYANGYMDHEAGLSVGWSFKLGKKSKWYFEPALSMSVHKTMLDDEYEGGTSYNTAIYFKFRKKAEVDPALGNFLFDLD